MVVRVLGEEKSKNLIAELISAIPEKEKTAINLILLS